MNTSPLIVSVGGQEYSLASQFRKAGQDLVVFVHGLGCSKEAFADAWDNPNVAPYSLLAFDLLGFGESPKPDDFSYSVADHAAVLAQVLSQYSDFRVHLVANSWGPIIGLLLPPETLAHLASFVNLEGRMVLDDVGNARKAAALSFGEFEQSFFPGMKEKYADPFKTAYRLDQALPLAYYNGAKSIVEVVSQGELPGRFLGLSCPKAYMYGDQNVQLKSITALAGVKMIEVTGSGHFMMKDNPAEFYAKLAEFIISIGTHA